MNLDNKLNLIKKIYSNKKDYNYFFNPFYSRKKIDIKILKKNWEKLYNRDINHLTHFYVHTPFCLEKCKFCQYHSWFDVKDKSTIENYLNYLEKYILEFWDILKWKKFWWLYFWWWTASLYSEKQLERLLKLIFDNISFNNEYLKEFELHPITTTFKKLEILKKYWFDRITFWIQSFNKKTIENEWRIYCTPNRFKELVDYAKRLWFDSINADLILWLNSETKEESLESLKKMLDCRPYTITLYTLQDNKETSNLYEWEDIFYKKVKNIHTFLVDNLINESDYHFSCTSINTWATLWLKWIFKSDKKRYDTHVNSIESIFWIWFWAYSHIFWIWKYYIPDDIYYLDNIKLNFENLTDLDEKNIFLSKCFQEWSININFFKKEYNIDLIKENKEVIDFLLKINKIEISNNKIIFTTKNIKETYIYWLLFFDLKFILHHSLYIDKNFKK